MGTNGFTPEEWRTAARIARRSIFTEGNPDLADAWEKAADQAEARLIPAGGMALTAEQVENVRAAREELRGYRNFTGYGRSHVNQLIAAVDALFPATEPAEPATQSTGGDCFDVCEGHPVDARTTAKPAEERCPTCNGSGDVHRMDGEWLGACDCPAGDSLRTTPVPSPVVPAPTETEAGHA